MNPNLPDIDIERWTRCEREALSGPDREPGGRHVAAVMHDFVRARLAGEPEPMPDMWGVRMDSTTPTARDISRSADLLADAVRSALRREGLTPAGAHASSDVYHLAPDPSLGEGGGLALVRVTHARRVTTQWMALARALGDDRLDDVTHGVIVHAPRVRLGDSERADVLIRPAAGLRDTWAAWQSRVLRILHGQEGALPRPGTHCARCTLDCEVRSFERRVLDGEAGVSS